MKTSANMLLIGVASAVGILAMTGCISDKERVARQIKDLVRQNRFDDARNLKVKQIIGGIPKTDEEKVKEELITTLVNPEEAKFIAARTKTLRNLVMGDLAKGDDTAARKHIYEFGVIGQPTVDGAIFLIKTGLLNSRVNPATYKRICSESEKTVSPLITSGEYEKAIAEIAKFKSVLAYPDAVEIGLDSAGNEAAAQRCEAVAVSKLIADTKSLIYTKTAYREGYEITDFVPNWSKVEAQLRSVRDALVKDDIDTAEADALYAMLLEGIKSYFDDDATHENLTTAQLNANIANLRADLRAGIAQKIESETAKKAEAGKKAEAESLRKLALELAAQAASEVDMNARMSAFVDAISDRTEPDINKVLGDGARVLRRYNAGYTVSPADATSLLVAATYMGFDDVMNLALSLKADINGFSTKDSLARAPYLIAMQFGFKGSAKSILKDAKRDVRDANGCGAVHYAVRYADVQSLLEALELGLDAKTGSKDGVTPLMVAASLDKIRAVQMLLPFSDVNAADAKGNTALINAARIGSLPITKALIASKAEIKAADKEGNGAFEYAVILPSESILAYLLDDIKMLPTERSVSWCVINGKVLPLTTLVAHGAEITDKHLAAAVKCGHLDMVKYLVSLGCDVNSEVVHSVTPAAGAVYDFIYANGFRADKAEVSAQTPSPGIIH